mmetsp:Transcript_51081/g.131731  ORF Transcript_51081/g.131731 Transcript_51081/m.131731 type:complete len:201 (-) Transcript_51081:1199-1801(-)
MEAFLRFTTTRNMRTRSPRARAVPTIWPSEAPTSMRVSCLVLGSTLLRIFLPQHTRGPLIVNQAPPVMPSCNSGRLPSMAIMRSLCSTTELIWSRFTKCAQPAFASCWFSASSSTSAKESIARLSDTATLSWLTGTWISEYRDFLAICGSWRLSRSSLTKLSRSRVSCSTSLAVRELKLAPKTAPVSACCRRVATEFPSG